MLQEKTRNLWLALVLMGGAIVRLAYLFSIWNDLSLTLPIIDSEYYHQWATALAHDRTGQANVFFMSPFYPYVLSILYKIFGSYPQVGALFQALGGLTLVWMIYLLGRRLFHPDVGLLAAFLAAFYRPFLYYEGVLLSSVLILLLNAGALLLLLSPQRRGWKDVAAGLLLGLSALTRPNVLVFALTLTAVLLTRSGHSGWKRALRLWLGVFLALAPTAERNHRLCGEWILTTASFGMNFYAGNNPAAEGLYWEAPFVSSAEPKYENLDHRREASRLSGHELSVTGASRFWTRQALVFIADQPLNYLKLISRKLFLFFHATEIPNNFSFYAAQDYSRFLGLIPFTFGSVAPIGIAFWLLGLRRREWAVAHAYGLSYVLATLIFFAASEYRLPLLLILLPMTAAGIQTIWRWIRSQLKTQGLMLTAVSALIALPVNMPTRFTAALTVPYMDYFNLGSVLQKQNRFQEAVVMLQRSLVLKPDFTEAHRLLGDSYHVLGLREQAAEEFRRAGEDPGRELIIRDAERLFDQAQELVKYGQSTKALDLYLQGLAIHPEPPAYVYFNIAYLALTTGDTLQAEHFLEEAAAADPQEARVPFLSGLIDESRSQWSPAAEKFKEALALQPTFHLARAHAALSCLRLGNVAEAGRLVEPLLGGKIDDPAVKVVVDLVAKEAGY